MAAYKVWLTVKDSYGNTKEVDGGTIELALEGISKDDITQIGNALPFDEYVRKDDAKDVLDPIFATDAELEEKTEEVSTAVEEKDSIKYLGFFD